MRHAMNVVGAVTKFLNPGQILVSTANQPLFAILKSIKWEIPAYDGRVPFMCGLRRIEMAA